jgi:hypothetical protein
MYNFIVRNEGETAKSGWALNLVAPQRWVKIYPLAFFRQHKTAQGHWFVLCFLSDMWPEFTPWIQRVALICTSIDFMSKAWYLLNCDWIIATFMLGLASVLNGIDCWLKTSLSSCSKFIFCACWLRRTALCRQQTNEWFKIFRSYFCILGLVIWSLCICYVSACWLMCRCDSGVSQLAIWKLLEHESEYFLTEINNTWSYSSTASVGQHPHVHIIPSLIMSGVLPSLQL